MARTKQKTVALTEETYRHLNMVKRYLALKQNKEVTMNETIAWMISQNMVVIKETWFDK